MAGVCANRGAPGVDGLTVDAVAAAGVEVFLQDLSQQLRAGLSSVGAAAGR